MKIKTHIEFVNEIYLKYKCKFSIRSLYFNAKTKIEIKCNDCGSVFYSRPTNLLSGFGCKNCHNIKLSKLKSMTDEIFCHRLFKKHKGNIISLEVYKNMKTKIKFKNIKCGHEFSLMPDDILSRDISCPKCGRLGLWAKSHDKFVEEISIINSDIEVLSKYIRSDKHIWVINKKCHHKWKTTPNRLLSGYDCPICRYSKGEKQIYKILRDEKYSFKSQKTFDGCVYKKHLKFDFYIESLNLCIEYNGRQHYEVVDIFGGLDGFKKTVKRDEIKINFCKENNINLLIIKYDDNILQKLKLFI